MTKLENKTLLHTILVLLFLSTIQSFSQYKENENIAVHPRIGILSNFYNADMTGFQNSANCGLLTSGSGWGYSISAALEKPVLNNKHHFSFGVSFVDRSGAFTNNLSFESRDPNTELLQTIQTEHELIASLSYLEFQPDFRLTILDNFLNGPLRIGSGIRLGIPIGATFEQQEKIVSPEGVVFVNRGGVRSETRDIASGDIGSINNFNLGLSFALENLSTIGNGNFLSQQLVFDYNFNDVVTDATWKTYSVRLEFGLRFSIEKIEEEEEIIEEEFIIKKPEPEPEPIIVEEPEPVKLPYSEVNIEEVDITQIETGNELLSTVPIIFSVFFETNSSEVKDDYLNTKQDIKLPDGLFSLNPVEANYYVFDILSNIYERNQNAEFELVASTSGNGYENDVLALSQERANSVKNVLIQKGIDESKISIKTRELPEYPSNNELAQGREENQRVEIKIKNAPTQEYVAFQKYTEVSGNISLVADFGNSEESLNLKTNVDNFDYVYSQPGEFEIPFKTRLKTLDDKVLPIEIAYQYDEINEAINYNADLTKERINKVELNLTNFEAILTFDFNSSQLSDINKELLKQLVSQLPEKSTIQILGSADAMGSAERNLLLENERAENTRKFIESISTKNLKIETGRTKQKYDEKTPQGRMLNRSIRIKVK